MKNRWFYLVLALLFVQSAFAQETVDNPSLELGISVFPRISLQITDDKGTEGNPKNFGLSLYGDAYFDIKPKLKLKTGIGIHNYYLEQIDYSVLFGCDNVNGSADPYNSFVKSESSTFFLGIPLEFRILFSDNRNHLYSKIGAEALIGIISKSESSIHECGSTSGIVFLEERGFTSRQVLLLLKLGLGYEFQFLENKVVYIEPLFEYSLFKSFEDNEDALINNSRLVNIGLLVGMKL